MPSVEVQKAGEIAYRETVPDGEPSGAPVLLIHGYPESSFMWRDLLAALAESRRRAVAPDLPGYGNSPLQREATWESHMEVVEDFRETLGLDRVALVVHDWGGLIGLRWAAEHPDAVAALVISNTGFFPDGKWHGMAKILQTEGQGEQAVDAMTREAFAEFLRSLGRGFDDAAIDEYWKAFGDERRRRGQLELYRSGDFSKLEPYEGRLAALDVPTLVLWGEQDQFASIAAAHRFHREIPHSELVLISDAGHFAFEDDPQRCAQAVTGFLEEAGL